MDPKDVVRRGYDVISLDYREDDANEGGYGPWLDRLRAEIPSGRAVLDLGCGCGVPVSRELAAAGLAVTGVDISEVQIARARQLVPDATFIRGDATEVDLPTGSFDAVVCLFALIHLPLDEQPALLSRMASWLRPGGRLLLTAGYRAWTGTEENWHGGTMWWSHADADTYRTWLADAGFGIDTEDFFPEGDSGHAVFWATRRQPTGGLQ